MAPVVLSKRPLFLVCSSGPSPDLHYPTPRDWKSYLSCFFDHDIKIVELTILFVEIKIFCIEDYQTIIEVEKNLDYTHF
jgi:hypothetical protein